MGMAHRERRNEGETMLLTWGIWWSFIFSARYARYMWYAFGASVLLYLIMQMIWQRLKKRKYRKTYLIGRANAIFSWCVFAHGMRYYTPHTTHRTLSAKLHRSQKTLTDSRMVHLITDISLTNAIYTTLHRPLDIPIGTSKHSRCGTTAACIFQWVGMRTHSL